MPYKVSSTICLQLPSKSHYTWVKVNFKGNMILENKQDHVPPAYEVLPWLLVNSGWHATSFTPRHQGPSGQLSASGLPSSAAPLATITHTDCLASPKPVT